MSVRFTAYMNEQEDEALRAMAEEQGCSMNYLVRCGVRVVTGKTVPRWLLRQLKEASDEKDR